MTKKSRISVRIDTKTKERALHVLNSMGLDISSAINMYLKRIGDTGALPFTPPMSLLISFKLQKLMLKRGE